MNPRVGSQGPDRTPGNRAGPATAEVHGPYGFVPLSTRVFFPEWGPAASRDLPFADGICGTFRLEVEAVSPIFVRGTDDPTQPFRLPDGMYALPGTSIRGMLRNVVEVATFGKLSRVNAHRYALRDLHNQKSYVSQMARIVDGQPVPLVNAGWLVPTGDAEQPAELRPCHFAKLEYAKLGELAEQAWGVPGFDPGRKQTSVDKHQRLIAAAAPEQGEELDWRPKAVKLRLERIDRPRLREIRSDYGQVTGPGATRCHVVMTGQPAPYVANRPKTKGSGAGNPKHHDFVFHGEAGASIPVSREQLAAFAFAHSDRGQQNNLGRSVKPNAEWDFWEKRVFGHVPAWFTDKPERGVPVFFLFEPDGSLRAMGLAMMFRLGARRSVAEAVRRIQPESTDPRLDFAETLFGTVPDTRRGEDTGAFALAGRVSFGVARAVGSPKPGPKVGPLVLGAPKASYYPSYVEQGATPGAEPGRDGKSKPDWKTWIQDGAVPRGWKRYRPIEGHRPLTPPHPKGGDGRLLDLARVGTVFHPLPAGTRFTLEVRLHNARPEELGALLWALDLGGESDAFHKLGLARPLGYGTVRLHTSEPQLARNDGVHVEKARCVEAFRQWADEAWTRAGGEGSWADSRAIRELVALSRPMPRDEAPHMQLDHPLHRNEFQKAKLEGRVLRPASTEGAVLPRFAPAVPTRPAVSATRPASAGGVPQAASTQAGPAPLPKHGARVRVRLTSQNKRGSWRGDLVNGSGSGTFVRGEPPPDAGIGTEHEAEVVRAPSRSTIELAWVQG